MPSSVFLDTQGWLALLNASDSRHAQASDNWLELMSQGTRVVLTDWIIAETGNGLARSRMKDRFVEVVRQMLDAPSVVVIVVDRELLDRALARYDEVLSIVVFWDFVRRRPA